MPQELILHIGYHKTGTSSIQHFIYKHKDKLLKDFGIYYPNTLIGETHNIYSYILANFYPYARPYPEISKEELLIQLTEEVKNINPKIILFSAEDFLLGIESLDDLVRILEPKKIKIIVYFRRQDKILESLYSESAKNSTSFNFFTLGPLYVWYFHGRMTLDYYQFLKKIESIFKSEIVEIIPRIYLRDIDKRFDVVEDFCSLLGISKSASQEQNIEKNISLSPTSIEALKRIKERYLIPIGIFEKVVSFLYEYDHRNPSRIKTLLSLEKRERILDFYEESNKKLFREYFNQENIFILSEEEKEFYKEQEKIPKNEIEAEIQEKYRKILEFIKDSSFTRRSKIYIDQKYGRSELILELIKARLIEDWVGGHVDVCNEEKVEGWLLELKDSSPYFVLRLNGICVYVGRTNLEREDIKEIYGVNVNAGFQVFWKDVNFPDEILTLPDDAELEVELIHEKTGYIIPGNYKKLLKKHIVKPRYKVVKTVSSLTKKAVYMAISHPIKKIDRIESNKEGSTIYYDRTKANGDWNTICTVPNDVKRIVLSLVYNNGETEKVEVEV